MRVPENLDEAIEWLKENIDESDRSKIFQRQIGFDFGRWIRNNWGLWNGSKLQKYFQNLGIRHADDMSAIILESFKRDLKEEDRDLESQIIYYREYWKNNGVDPDKIGIEEE